MTFNYNNRVLRALSGPARKRLNLTSVVLEVNHEVEFPGTLIKSLFFLESGMASMTTTFLNGDQAEIGMAGLESVVGVGALVGSLRSLNRVYMQIAGDGFSCSVANARAEFERFGEFHDLCLRSLQAQFIQSAQTAGCNARHSVEQRLSRWLLLSANRVGSNSFTLSQEFMADMIGNTRPTVSVVAATLRERGLISYARGKITILDSGRLEEQSCECFRVVVDYLDNFLNWDNFNVPPSLNGKSIA